MVIKSLGWISRHHFSLGVNPRRESATQHQTVPIGNRLVGTTDNDSRRGHGIILIMLIGEITVVNIEPEISWIRAVSGNKTMNDGVDAHQIIEATGDSVPIIII